MTEGLRERKKRLTRQRISDTATAMFLDRGFDAVTVAEVARACEVSEKTVFNYFPTKESLVLDQEPGWTADIRRVLGGAESPVEAIVGIIVEQLQQVYDGPPVGDETRRVRELIQRTPALQAANQQMTERVAGVVAEAVAARLGVDPGEPEPQIVAFALVGLWRVQFQSMGRGRGKDQVIDDVRRAASVLEGGLGRIFQSQ